MSHEKQKVKVPRSIGVIIDGNRRWAKERGLPSFAGHYAGFEKLKEFFRWSTDEGIAYVTAYCFSTENWERSTEEVNYMMDLFRVFFEKDFSTFKKEGYRFRFVGNHTRVPHDIREMIAKAERETRENTGLTVVIAFSYGGRNEIVAAVEKLVADWGREKGPITAERFSRYLWTADLPDPDLIIRTGGEQRLSNFLTWQSVYSELFFLPMGWPAITRADLTKVLEEFAERERRFGK